MVAIILSAIVVGLAGSLHCIGMCGPLMMALPSHSNSRGAWLFGRLINQLGRLVTYSLLGAIVGLVGQSIAAAGLQQWLSIASGIFMLLFIAWPAGWKGLNSGPFRIIHFLKSKFALLLQKKTRLSLFALGALNGLLPCGMVYMALSASLATGSVAKGSLFMFLFGLGTSPALMAVSGLGNFIKSKIRLKSYKTAQVFLAGIALLLVLRGANLGIPYVSPKVEMKTQQMDCCSRPH